MGEFILAEAVFLSLMGVYSRILGIRVAQMEGEEDPSGRSLHLELT